MVGKVAPDDLRALLAGFRIGTWLGWQIESNWTRPALFALYSAIKPITATMILVVMYVIIRRDSASDFFAYMYVGNAFYLIVSQVLMGISSAVLHDREYFRTLKYVCLSPAPLYGYLLGRGVARTAIAAFGVVVTLAFGVVALRLPLYVQQFDWALLVISLALAITSLCALGLLLAGISLVVARHGWYMGEAVGGAFYLASGAIFPPEVLPGWLQGIGLALPITYWLEATRRATLGKSISTLLSGFATPEVILLLFITTVLSTIISLVAFGFAERQAKERGLIDMTTGY